MHGTFNGLQWSDRAAPVQRSLHDLRVPADRFCQTDMRYVGFWTPFATPQPTPGCVRAGAAQCAGAAAAGQPQGQPPLPGVLPHSPAGGHDGAVHAQRHPPGAGGGPGPGAEPCSACHPCCGGVRGPGPCCPCMQFLLLAGRGCDLCVSCPGMMERPGSWRASVHSGLALCSTCRRLQPSVLHASTPGTHDQLRGRT